MRIGALLSLLLLCSDFATAQAPPQREHPRFAAGAIWNQNISGVTPDTNSSAMTAASVGWGTGSTSFQLDFSMHLLYASWAGYTNQPLAKNSTYYLPDCETGYLFPVPAIGAVEGVPDYTSCNYTGGDDCHLSVVLGNTLYESFQTGVDAGGLHSTCVLKWHLNLVYPPEGRGDGCTSTDAAGFPIAPLLFTADEVAAGHIDHAIRFILPNNRVRRGYVRPATHGTNTTGVAGAPYYGVHFRLRADYPIDSLPSEGAKVVARAMQKYGMYHADGGNIALTAQSDKNTSAKWAGLLGPKDLAALKVTDFEVVPHGNPVTLTMNCSRL